MPPRHRAASRLPNDCARVVKLSLKGASAISSSKKAATHRRGRGHSGLVVRNGRPGNIQPAVHVIRTAPGGALETSWCSLRQGQASQMADQITSLLRGANWGTARHLRLPKPSGSKEWKKALVRSSARAKEGGLHVLQFLPA